MKRGEQGVIGISADALQSTANYFIMWWPETGLNRRRRPFQGRALPLSYLASVQTFRLQFPARVPAKPERVGSSTNSALQQLCEYINSRRHGQTPTHVPIRSICIDAGESSISAELDTHGQPGNFTR